MPPIRALVLSLALPACAVAQPANDLCGNAAPAAVGTTLGTNLGATTDVSQSSCAALDDRDVWFTFTAPADAIYRFETIEHESAVLFDTSISLYETCGGDELACDDDSGAGNLSRTDRAMLTGQTVLIRVAGPFSLEESFALRIGDAPPRPVNDDCDGALPLTLGVPVTESTIEAQPGAPAPCTESRVDLWYTSTTPAAGRYRFTVTGEFGHGVTVYTDCSLLNVLGCHENCGAHGRLDIPLGENASVLIRAHNCFDLQGPLTVAVEISPPIPANDEPAGAIPVSPSSSTPGTTVGATGEDISGECGFNDAYDVWYAFTNPGPEPLIFNIAANPVGDFDPILGVFNATATVEIACSDDGGVEFGAAANVPVGPGQTVLLRVSGHNRAEGGFTLSINAGAAPAANDDCAGALPLAPGSSISGTTTNATGSFDHSSCGVEDDIDVWYAFTNPAASPRAFSFDTTGATTLADINLAVFSACDGDELACTTGFGPDLPARIDLILAPSQTVLIRLAGFDRSVGEFVLNASAGTPPPPPPANDACATALQITHTPFDHTVAVGAADDDLPDITCNFAEEGVTRSGVWYAITPAISGRLLVEQLVTSEIGIALFTGSCGTLAETDCSASRLNLFPVTAGVPYLILVGQLEDRPASPLAQLQLRFDLFSNLPLGDACADAVPIDLPTRGWINTFPASNEGIADAPVGSCNSPNSQIVGTAFSVYFAIDPPADGRLVGSVRTPFYDAIAAFYTGSCGDLTEIACAEDPQPIAIDVPVSAGTRTLMQVGVFGIDAENAGSTFIDLSFVPACPADFDGQNGVQVADIFAFLRAWFANSPSADFDGQNGIQVADIFSFLRAWFAGC